MAVKRKLIEKRRRGVLGWIFLTLFCLWNALMVFVMISGIEKSVEFSQQVTAEGGSAAHEMGIGLAIMMVLIIWACGASILGLAVLLSRGRREMIEVSE